MPAKLAQRVVKVKQKISYCIPIRFYNWTQWIIYPHYVGKLMCAMIVAFSGYQKIYIIKILLIFDH